MYKWKQNICLEVWVCVAELFLCHGTFMMQVRDIHLSHTNSSDFITLNSLINVKISCKSVLLFMVFSLVERVLLTVTVYCISVFSWLPVSRLEANACCQQQKSHLMGIQDINDTPAPGKKHWGNESFFFLLFSFCYLNWSLFFFSCGWRHKMGAEVFWSGLNGRVTEGVWEWSDGTTHIQYLSYVNLILRQC